MSIDYEALRQAQAHDRAWFEQHLDREYCLRRAWSAEYSGARPAGFEAFCILHRQDLEQHWNHRFFGAPITFETDRTDAAIREILAALALDSRAFVK